MSTCAGPVTTCVPAELAGLVDEWRAGGTAEQLAAGVVVSSLQASALRTAAMWTIMQKGLDGCDEALSRVAHAWQQLTLLRVAFAEAGVRDVIPVDASGYPADQSQLAPGAAVVAVSGDNSLPVTIAPRFSECLLLEQVRALVPGLIAREQQLPLPWCSLTGS